MHSWNAVVIEDDPSVRELLEIVLTQSGFDVVTSGDGPSGIEAVRECQPLLTTCDVSMPGMDGLATAKRIRAFSDTFLIMISAMGEEIDVVQGLEAGADDYVLKPFSPRELRARVDAMVRRLQAQGRLPDAMPAETGPTPEPWVASALREVASETWTPADDPRPADQVPPSPVSPAAPLSPAVAPSPAGPLRPMAPPHPVSPATARPAAPAAAAASANNDYHPGLTASSAGTTMTATPSGAVVLEHNGLYVDLETRMVSAGGKTVELTRSEFDLLVTVLESGRRVRSKADLVLALRGQGHVTSYYVNEADKRSVEVHVANLRRKIGDNATTPTYVETVRGVGYRLAPAQ